MRVRLTVTVIGSEAELRSDVDAAKLARAAQHRDDVAHDLVEIEHIDVVGAGSRELHQALAVRGDVLADALEIGKDRARERGDVFVRGERGRELVDRGDLDLRDVAQLVTDTTGERAERGAAFGEQQRRARLRRAAARSTR